MLDLPVLHLAVVCPEGPLDYTAERPYFRASAAVVCPEGPLDYTWGYMGAEFR